MSNPSNKSTAGFWGLLTLLLLIPPLGLPLPAGWGGGRAWAEPNVFEQRQIATRALQSFRAVIGLWREELYFELYDYGTKTTQARISREKFAQRMVELSWVPEGEPNPKFLKTSFRFRTMVYVNSRLTYRHKFNPAEKFSKDHSFMMLLEDGTWRIDLIQLVRAPFA